MSCTYFVQHGGALVSSLLIMVMAGPLAAVEGPGPAEQVAAQVLRQQAQRQPQLAAHFNALAAGLRSGSMSMTEVEQVLRIIQLGQSPSREIAGPKTVPAQDPEQVLGLLDTPRTPPSTQTAAPVRADDAGEQPAPAPTSIEDLERWAGARAPELDPDPALDEPVPESPAASDTLSPLEAAAPKPALATAAPVMPSDQADLPDLDARVRMVETRKAGERDMQMVFIDRGSAQGLAQGQRLRVERGGEAVVLLSVFNVREEMAVAVVLDGSWTAISNNEVRKGDNVVRDR